MAQLLPTEQSFSPEAYLSTFHQDSSTRALRKGMQLLGQELSERTGGAPPADLGL